MYTISISYKFVSFFWLQSYEISPSWEKMQQLVRATQPYKIFMGAPILPTLILIVALCYTVINRVLGLKLGL